MAYNRYSEFINNDEVKMLPFINLPKKTSDKIETYKLGITRLDILSNKYYKNPNYGFLILLANPELGSFEFSIEDNSELIIPFPLETTLKDYKNEVLKYKQYYGI